MARCAHCGTETLLHISDVPICTQCVDLSPDKRAVRGRLYADLAAAVKRADSASEAFAKARDEMMKAHHRLNDFLDRGIVPDDLKRSG